MFQEPYDHELQTWKTHRSKYINYTNMMATIVSPEHATS